ncbi:MAG TPA: hypothetical protein VE046_03720 [Steroidobacteraceae bacterium]|nr:hypothetical protein [Steroidobacteraceae bacterium]
MKNLLATTAVLEFGTGLVLVSIPSVLATLLFGAPLEAWPSAWRSTTPAPLLSSCTRAWRCGYRASAFGRQSWFTRA